MFYELYHLVREWNEVIFEVVMGKSQDLFKVLQSCGLSCAKIGFYLTSPLSDRLFLFNFLSGQ